MKKSNLKKAAAIGLGCTIILSNIAFASTQNNILNNASETKYFSENILFENNIIKAIDGVGIKIDGNLVKINSFIENGRVLSPMLEIIEKLGAKVEIDQQSKIVKIYTEDIKIELNIGDNKARVLRNIDGTSKEETINLDVSAKQLNDVIYVPVRFIAETLGADVNWDISSRTVIIEMKDGDIISIEKPIDFIIPEKEEITGNVLLSKWYENNYKTKGIYSTTDGEWMYVLISAGEMPTGGYSLEIDSITEVTPKTAYIYAVLQSPDKDSFVTDALTYPNAVAKFKRDDIEKVQWDLVGYNQENENELKEIKNIVAGFGKKLQLISLVGPKDTLSKSIEENYSDFVSADLIKKWQIDPENAPGRVTSSPWPDHINILSINNISESEYEVNGEIIEKTSVEIINNGIAAKRPVSIKVKKIDGSWKITDVAVGGYEDLNSVFYENTKYGFSFALPKSWENFSVINEQWKGMSLEEPQQNITETGDIIYLRHPQWTKENPRQDIPVMIFTHKQWESVQQEKLSVGAAPVAPRELGRNSSYVFALPARYNYSFPTGYEEVEDILNKNPIQTFEITDIK